MTGRRLIENCVRLQTPDWPGQARSWHSEIEGAVEQSLCPHLCSQSTFISTREEYREESVIKELFVFFFWNPLRKRRCFFQPKITVFLPIFINKFYSAKKILSSPQIFQKGFGLQEIPHDSFRRRNKGFVPIVIFNFITRSSKEMGELHYISLHTVKTNKKINTPLFLKMSHGWPFLSLILWQILLDFFLRTRFLISFCVWRKFEEPSTGLDPQSVPTQ